MTLTDFILLDEAQKQKALLHEGVLIGKRSDESYFMFLFQLPGYYVEAICNREAKKPEEYRLFQDMHLLQPYLDQISLQGLLN
jgi:hypothetical protein